MEVHWAEDEKLVEIVERRRMEGGYLLAEVTQKVPELAVHEPMSQGKKATVIEEKKKVKGWSTEEIKKPKRGQEKDTEEMIEWRSMSQEEMDKMLEEAGGEY